MKKYGKFFRFLIIIIFLGFITLMTFEGKFTSVFNNIEDLLSGKKARPKYHCTKAMYPSTNTLR